jgi:hypothetical protein
MGSVVLAPSCDLPEDAGVVDVPSDDAEAVFIGGNGFRAAAARTATSKTAPRNFGVSIELFRLVLTSN